MPPALETVQAARRFTRSALEGVPSDVVDTAELLAGELVTNAVLHARTEVELRVTAVSGRVRVEVGDRRPDRGVVPHDRHPYACTGRGLTLVEELATSHGVHVGEDRKTVWFELWPRPLTPPMSAWEIMAPPGPTRTVTLIDVPYSLYWAAQQQWEGLLRELRLASSAGQTVVRAQDLAVAEDASTMICACMRAAMQRDILESSTLSVIVAFPDDAAPGVMTLRRVLAVGDAEGQQASLLSLPALPQIRAFRQWLLAQVAGQLSGGKPTAWTLNPSPPGATPSELSPWNANEVQTADTPTVAADEGNRIIAASDSAASLLGWHPHELIGQPLTVLIPEHLRDRHRAAFASLLLTGEPRILGRSIPVPALHRDGRLLPIRLHIQTQEAVDGRTVFVAQLTTRTAPPAAIATPPEAAWRGSRSAPGPMPGPVRRPTAVKKAPDEDAEAPAAPEHLSLLADTGTALISTADLHVRVLRVCQVLTRRLAGWCAVDLVDHQGQVERVCIVHRDPRALATEAHLGKLPPPSESTRGSLPRVLRGAGPLLITDIPRFGWADNPLDARQFELFGQLGADSVIMAPLRAGREVLGALTLARTREQDPFAEADILLVAEVARRLAAGLAHARVLQSAQYTAEHLQRALLPDLPSVPHLDMLARYSPSSTTAEVGGDWYDAFILPTGDTALVIGDVSGHDLQAAVAMSTLRNMLRGIAVDRREPPDDVLGRLDLAALSLYPQAIATCIYAVVKGGEEGPWELHHTSAGHMPPLLISPEGEARYLESGAGMLLGMRPGTRRPTARTRLPAHSTLLLFTDGLIERRGESIDDAMGRLRRHTGGLARAPLDVLCDELIIALGADSTDDIAMLAVRPRPPE